MDIHLNQSVANTFNHDWIIEIGSTLAFIIEIWSLIFTDFSWKINVSSFESISFLKFSKGLVFLSSISWKWEGDFGIRSSKVQFLCQFLIERHLFPECIHANPSSPSEEFAPFKLPASRWITTWNRGHLSRSWVRGSEKERSTPIF